MQATRPFVYSSCSDLWCVSAYFNPTHRLSRRQNFEDFIGPIRAANIPHLIVECAFEQDQFELPPGPNIIQVRSPHVLWQKERLLNLAVSLLPAKAKKVAWLDCDLIFANPDWALQAARLLDDVEVVQLYGRSIRQGPKGGFSETTALEILPAMSKVYAESDRRSQLSGLVQHGHTGFAWAARRELLAAVGLFDLPFDVGADHLMAHVFWRELESDCLKHTLQIHSLPGKVKRSTTWSLLKRLLSGPLRRWLAGLAPARQNKVIEGCFRSWAERWVAQTQGRVGYVSGDLHHLWHELEIRRNVGDTRNRIQALRLDLGEDIVIGENGTWSWKNANPIREKWARSLFLPEE